MVRKSECIGIYLRLSVEDYDVELEREGKLKEESNSISNQRKVIEDFLRRRKEFADCVWFPYCDDGYSGTNFNRPDFQRMIEDCKKGKIDTIIFKDYSRFGRNFLGVGNFLEEVLPELKVRVISVNDGYDSNNEIGEAQGIHIPVKNLINDYYVKDLSKKVKSGIRSRQTRGEFVSAGAIFGYKKNPENYHQLIVDEETAPIVRMVFQYALEGMNGIQIARRLNELQVMTPAWYAKRTRRREYPMDGKTVWTSAKVMKIIRDQRYAGDMVGNVRVRTQIAKNDNVMVDRKDWIVVEDTHEGIVEKEVFWKVNGEVMPLKERKGGAKGEDRRRGIFYCPYCGRVLMRTNVVENAYYECPRGLYESGMECGKVRVSEKVLLETLSVMIGKYIEVLVERDKMVPRMKRERMEKHEAGMTIGDLEGEISRLVQSKMGLYERYREEGISKKEYIFKKKQIGMQIEELEGKKEKIVNGVGDRDEQVQLEQRLREVIGRYRDRKEFSYGEIAEFVSRVVVVSEVEMEVVWQFEEILNIL